MIHTFYRNGVPEAVEAERWAWGAIYDDGTELLQFDGKGVFHQLAEIDQDKLKMFVMYKLEEQGKRIDMPFDPVTMQLIHFYRTVRFDAGGPSDRTVRAYVFGWKDRTTGSTAYHFILPDDRIIVTPHREIELAAFDL